MKEIKLNKGYVALIDDEDFELVSKYKWRSIRNDDCVYAISQTSDGNGGSRNVLMHRLVMGVDGVTADDNKVDHKNSNGLDDRKENLRLGTMSDNSRSKRKGSGRNGRIMTSKFKGVHLNRGKWRCCIRPITKGKLLHLGYFKTEEEAALAYDKAARFYFKEFAKLNFPEKENAPDMSAL